MEPMKAVVILMVMLFVSPFVLQAATAWSFVGSVLVLISVPMIALLAFRSYRWYYRIKAVPEMRLDYPEEDDVPGENGPEEP